MSVRGRRRRSLVRQKCGVDNAGGARERGELNRVALRGRRSACSSSAGIAVGQNADAENRRGRRGFQNAAAEIRESRERPMTVRIARAAQTPRRFAATRHVAKFARVALHDRRLARGRDDDATICCGSNARRGFAGKDQCGGAGIGDFHICGVRDE